MQPYFSIIIPLFNKKQFIESTLKSVINQTFTDFEVIIVDDGSTDGSSAIVKTINDDRVSLISIENKGVSHARNLGIAKAKANYLVFIDADDFWYPNHLEDFKFLIEEYSNCGMYCKAYDKDFKVSKQTSHLNGFKQNWHGILDNYFKASLKLSIATSSSVMIPKETFTSVGVFNENYNSGEDTDMWIKIALNHSVVFYNKISVSLNMYANNKATHNALQEMRHINFNDYGSEAQNNNPLNTYLNLNTFSRYIKLRVNGLDQQAKAIKKDIDTKQLSRTQNFILNLPGWMLKLLVKLQLLGKRFNLHLTVFK